MERVKMGDCCIPLFRFENYTHITRADADAMWRYLVNRPAVQQNNPDHQLRSPMTSAGCLLGGGP